MTDAVHSFQKGPADSMQTREAHIDKGGPESASLSRECGDCTADERDQRHSVLYLAGVKPSDDQAIRNWAADHGIDPAWVRSHRVTPNHEAGTLVRLTQGEGEIP